VPEESFNEVSLSASFAARNSFKPETISKAFSPRY
jgi:hypothetical protein